MKLTNQKLIFFGLVATLLFNVVVLSPFNIFFINSAYSFSYLIIIPGFLIQRLLRIRGITFFESIVYSVGLSILFLYLVGLSTNLLVLLPNMPEPLNMPNSLIIFNIYIVLLLLFNLMKEKDSLVHITFPKLPFLHIFFYIIPIFFLILSIFGAQSLNENGANTLTMLLLFFIALYVLFTVIFLKKLEKFYFEIPVYLTAISLLLMFSLRSSYIIGWDIYQEYKVFLLTEGHHLWSMNNFQDPYNACLSITILPTLLHYFTHVNNPYVFKILFQIMFALVPVTIYSLTIRYSNRIVSFLSAFFFMSTLDFFLEMPAIDRQEVAFLLFGLLLLVLFTQQLTSRQKEVLFVIISATIVLSHYSTTYLLIAIFTFAATCLLIYRFVFRKLFHWPTENYTLKPVPVIIFVLFSFLWLGIITSTSDNVLYTVNSTIDNFNNYQMQTLNTSIIDQFLFPHSDNINDLIPQEINETKIEYTKYHLQFYPASTYKDYSPTVVSTNLPLFIPGAINNITVFVSYTVLKIIKALIIIGFVLTILLFRKGFFPAEYAALSLGFAVALLAITSIPALSSFYPIGRLDQQTLFLIALPTTLFLFLILRFIPFKIRTILITLFFIIYFLNTTTFTSQLVGGQEPQIFLNNSGTYYNEIYLHSSELTSIHWLYANKDKNSPVFGDIGSTEKMNVYSGVTYLDVYKVVFPSLISENAYVYSNYANTMYSIGITNPKDNRLEYNFPTSFLNTNKNLIYNNFYTKIYK